MANLQVRDMDDVLYEDLKRRARAQHRSLSQEVVHIIEDYLSRPLVDPRTQTSLFLELSGSWQGTESSQQILKSIRKARVNSKRFRNPRGLPA
jgi:plasmid stability protein